MKAKAKKKRPTHVVKIWFSLDDNGYRWNAKHRNGKIIADGAEGYRRHADCARALHNFLKAAKAGTIEVK